MSCSVSKCRLLFFSGYGYRNTEGGSNNYYQNGYQQRDSFGNNSYGGGYKRGIRGGISRGMDRGGECTCTGFIKYMWVVGCLLPHCAYSTCLPSVNTLSTCLPEYSNRVERERERERLPVHSGYYREWQMAYWVGGGCETDGWVQICALSVVNLGMVNCITNLDHLGEFT